MQEKRLWTKPKSSGGIENPCFLSAALLYGPSRSDVQCFRAKCCGLESRLLSCGSFRSKDPGALL